MNHSTVFRIVATVFLLIPALPKGSAAESVADSTVLMIEPALVHLRAGGDREWSSFPEQPQDSMMSRTFQSSVNDGEWTLTLRQQDIKQRWDVRVNDVLVGRLVQDEMDRFTDFVVPAETLRDGENVLEIRQTGRDTPDDIRVGQVQLVSVPKKQRRHAATVIVALVDESNRLTPGRITITNREGTLVPVGAQSEQGLAVREGVVYTSIGLAEFGVSEGDYRIHGGRGFEYSVSSSMLQATTGQLIKRTLQLTREVDTTGWVACDTHVHTVTHSGHGDSTIEERMVTLAGEGVEFPIATDHNKHIDYESIARAANVRSFFTPVIGNEVTTKQGHFNIFPVQPGAPVPDHTLTDWDKLGQNIRDTPNVRVVILNHGRDIHAGFRPFSPRHHIPVTGENLDQRTLPANAMELINSGAVQTDPMQLFGDWCGLINRGVPITPVGSSDSHDVSRYIVGQGRTYIQCDDAVPGNIDVDAATKAFTEGRVLVSYGLLAKLKVNNEFGPGDVVSLADSKAPVQVTAKILGPSWAAAKTATLYINGRSARTKSIAKAKRKSPVDITVDWTIPRDELRHDSWLCVVTRGPGIKAPYWQTAKPYQPDSAEFNPYTFASTGPVRIDVDGDGFSSAYDYAQQIVGAGESDLPRIIKRLVEFDSSVAIQVASLLQDSGLNFDSDAIRDAPEEIRTALNQYQQAWRESQRARVESVE